MSARMCFSYRNLKHTPKATFVEEQRGFVFMCSIGESVGTDSAENDAGGPV